MRETVVNKWCDACMNEEEVREPAIYTYTVGLTLGETARPPLKVLELCEIHNKLIADLEQLLEATGQMPEVKAPATATISVYSRAHAGREGTPETLKSNPPMDCPICQTSMRKNSVRLHIWTQHLDGEKTRVVPKACPTCGERPEQMASHRSAAHGYSALDEAMDTWRERNR